MYLASKELQEQAGITKQAKSAIKYGVLTMGGSDKVGQIDANVAVTTGHCGSVPSTADGPIYVSIKPEGTPAD
jgi:hypothetical protein